MTVAIVLPPDEGFTPEAAGATGLLVRRLVGAGADGVVIGAPVAAPPFPGVRYVPAPPGLGLGRAARYVAGVARVLRGIQPALIEVHGRPDVALGLASVLPGTPIVLWLAGDPQAMRRARTRGERRYLLSRMALVVTASDWIRRRLVDGLPPLVRPPVVLPACVDLPAPLDGPRTPEFLFAGRIAADTGADAFVAACGEVLPHLPGWRGRIIGTGHAVPDSPFLQYMRLAATVAGVELLGGPSHAAALAALGRAAVAVVPSRWEEPSGLPALEALAGGAALVCSPRGGLPEVAGDAAWYADPAKPGALNAAMLTLATDPDLRDRLSAAGRAQAARFSAERTVATVLMLRQALVR